MSVSLKYWTNDGKYVIIIARIPRALTREGEWLVLNGMDKNLQLY